MAESGRRLPDDVCEYYIYPPLPMTFDDEVIERQLEQYMDLYLAHVSEWLVDYIWQHQPFNLQVVTGLGHLKGSTNFGDNVEDEWFIVWLLHQITKQFPEIVAKIHDNDGEFMLIEAANELPKWLQPETAENRIYIYRGKVHIIPVPQNPSDAAMFPIFTPSIEEAVKCLSDYPDNTLATPGIQHAISSRINGYPGKAKESIHRANCFIPAVALAVLKENPNLVAAAVQAFFYRTPDDLKACRSFAYFRSGSRVMGQVRMTRCQYAQLLQQRFQPDSRSGFTMPSQSSNEFKAKDLGMKLAHGFEMMCAQCVGRPGVSSQSRPPTARWQRYLRALQDKGYFKGQLEGSKLYRELYDKAAKYYQEMLASQEGSWPEPSQQLMNLISTVQYDVEVMRREEKNLPREDDDSWINVTVDSLDDILSKRMSTISTCSATADQYDEMASNMKSFIDKRSSHEGAEFPDQEEGDIKFGAGGFIHAMQKMFEFEDPSNSDSDMSEYGSDDDNDLDAMINAASGKKRRPKSKDPAQMQKYMEQMDRELAKTEVGKSFEREASSSRPAAPPRKKNKAKGSAPVADTEDFDDIDQIDDDFRPVNVDANLVKNMLESQNSQQGNAGPASNILRSMARNKENQGPRK
ncbi:protein ecdysoneless homolog isoform X2 [Lineus longissimus]|uniref:protein ecdysoneless homolog isoform X2 n=1 Tax=Lineus longissimus TaxID=88925 RepID=UPI00315DAC09